MKGLKCRSSQIPPGPHAIDSEAKNSSLPARALPIPNRFFTLKDGARTNAGNLFRVWP